MWRNEDCLPKKLVEYKSVSMKRYEGKSSSDDDERVRVMMPKRVRVVNTDPDATNSLSDKGSGNSCLSYSRLVKRHIQEINIEFADYSSCCSKGRKDYKDKGSFQESKVVVRHTHDIVEEATKAYDNASIQLRGPYVATNFYEAASISKYNMTTRTSVEIETGSYLCVGKRNAKEVSEFMELSIILCYDGESFEEECLLVSLPTSALRFSQSSATFDDMLTSLSIKKQIISPSIDDDNKGPINNMKSNFQDGFFGFGDLDNYATTLDSMFNCSLLDFILNVPFPSEFLSLLGGFEPCLTKNEGVNDLCFAVQHTVPSSFNGGSLDLSMMASSKNPTSGKLYRVLKALEDRKVFLDATTFRPKTMYGQTNACVLPDGKFGAIEVNKTNVFIVTKRIGLNLAYQHMSKIPEKPTCLVKLTSHDLINLPMKSPLASSEVVYALPMLTILLDKGTGIVTSVPSDSSDEYMALLDLKLKAPQRVKFGVKDERVLPFEVIPIINILEFGDRSTKKVCMDLKIKRQNDKDNLAKAKRLIYLKGFTEGEMLMDELKSMKVQEAKPLIKRMLLENGQAIM
eukprot:Gb_19958 [translate_table: standard]